MPPNRHSLVGHLPGLMQRRDKILVSADRGGGDKRGWEFGLNMRRRQFIMGTNPRGDGISGE